jgi:hypothetical protein
MTGEGTLNSDSRYNCIGGARKGHEEGIALRIDLVAVMLVERCTQEISALGKHVAVVLTQVLE